MVPVLAVLVAGAIGASALALQRAATTNAVRGDVTALRGQVADLTARLAAEQRALVRTQHSLASLRRASNAKATVGNLDRLELSVSRQGAAIQMLRVCIPQLRREFEGLKMQTVGVNGWLTGASLLRPATMSAACSSALAGS
jgi:hypothetical protein